MPIYEYQCEKCGSVTEAIQNFSDPPLTACTSCSGALHKLISQSSFHLKGSGWYVTDYAGRKTATAPPEKAEKKSSAPDSGGPAATGSTTPETKTSTTTAT